MTLASPALWPDNGTVLAMRNPFGPGETTSKVATAINAKIVFKSMFSAINVRKLICT